MKIIVTIRGPVSAMKSPAARRIEDAINSSPSGMTCTVFDHELFEGDKYFEENYNRVFAAAVASESEVCVIVIGTGVETGAPVDIRIDPGLVGSKVLFRALADFAHEVEGMG
jgi:hypothetical protein